MEGGGIEYKKLAPKRDFLVQYKRGYDKDKYISCYNDQILKYLTPEGVIEDIINMLNQDRRLALELDESKYGLKLWNNPNINIALICYEKSGDFCHRHIVADWLKASGIEVNEWVES